MKNFIQDRYEKWRSFFKDTESLDPNIFPVMFTVEESRSILIENLPSSDRQINIVNEENILQFFGYISKNNSELKITIWYDFKLNDWELPLSPLYHVDLLKRLIEWRKEKDGNISEVTIMPRENSIYLSYTVIPSLSNSISLFEVYKTGKEIDEWARNIVFELQEGVGKFHLKISADYSISNFLNNTELLNRVQDEVDSNKKGKFLEDLISRLFASINGFEVNERVRTETEEIDILILNNSNESIWNKESLLVLVECKNWSTKCGKNELVQFKEKVKNRYGRAKIGFLISWNGFNDTIGKELLRSSQDDIIIVPVTGKEVIEGMTAPDFGVVVKKWFIDSVSK